MQSIGKEEVKKIFHHIRQTMDENKEELIRLDGEMGDGDLGLTMSKAFSKADDELEHIDETDLGKLFFKIGMTMSKAAPSTMGTLMATGFMRGGKALTGKEFLGTEDFATFFEHFVGGIMDRGKSKPGEKTIIDALKPAADALQAASGKGVKEAFENALAAAEEGVEATKEMLPQHGRIAYYQDKSKGKQDPGATVGMLLIKALYEAV